MKVFLPIKGLLLLSACVSVIFPACGASEMVLATEAPQIGTFHLRSSMMADGSFRNPPFPFDPYGGARPVYELDRSNRLYFVEDSMEDFLVFRVRSVLGIPFTATFEQEESRAASQTLEELDFGEQPQAVEPPQFLYGTDLCLLPPVLLPNGSYLLSITNAPESGWEDDVYDLFFTDNLRTLPPPGLSVTNWLWLGRSAAGTPSFTVSSLAGIQGWFRLGTSLDSDQDGLTDALEQLTSHTDPHDPCSAADANMNGVPDWLETAMGFDPAQPNDLGTSNSGYSLFVAQPNAAGVLP